MRMRTQAVLTAIVLGLVLGAAAVSAQAKTIKLTIVAGHPPAFTWVKVAGEFFVPEVDKRLAEAGGKYKIKWNQAYGGTIAKAGGVLEAIQGGIADMGVVGTIFEASKMPLHNVTYMTPYGSGDISKVLDTVEQLKTRIPAVGKEWTKHNLVPLGGFALDTYGVLTNFPVKTVDDLAGHKIAAPGPSANWVKGTGAVAVAGNLTTYYNDIKTGVYEGALTFMTAAAAAKLHEVAPYICYANIGSQYAGGLVVNKDVWDSLPPEVRKVFVDVGIEYSKKIAEVQTARAEKSLKMMVDGGAKLVKLTFDERKRWADKLPNIPMDWAKAMDKKGLPGTDVVKGFLNGLRERGTKLPRDWDK